MIMETGLYRTPGAENKTHELKILPEYFRQALAGNKWWELRKNDRDFKISDKVILKEYEPENGYTGREFTATIVYIFFGGSYGLEEGYCILSIR